MHCTYGVSQGTDDRGQATTKVRYSLVELLLDVPDSPLLLAWAASPTKRLAVDIIFRNAVGGPALETLHLAAAYCVGYFEVFESGNFLTGAYQCRVTLTDPGGWTISPGGPTRALLITPGYLPNFTTVAEQTALREAAAKEVADLAAKEAAAKLAAEAIGEEVAPPTLGALARLLAILPEAVAAVMLAVFIPTNNPDAYDYDRAYSYLNSLTPEQVRRDLAALEQRYLAGPLTEHEQLLALLAKVRGLYLGAPGALKAYYAPRPAELALVAQPKSPLTPTPSI